MKSEPAKKPRGRPRTVDRQHTIERAMACYWQDDLHTLSLNAICRRVGISKPGLYRDFGGEDGLMEAAIAHYGDVVVAPVLERLEADRPFAEMLADLVTWQTEPRDGPAGCLLAKMRSSPSRLGPTTRARVGALRDDMRRAYASWYRRALDRDEVNPTIAPDLAAFVLDTQLTHVIVQMALGEPRDRVRAQVGIALQGLQRR